MHAHAHSTWILRLSTIPCNWLYFPEHGCTSGILSVLITVVITFSRREAPNKKVHSCFRCHFALASVPGFLSDAHALQSVLVLLAIVVGVPPLPLSPPQSRNACALRVGTIWKILIR
jgi:hypothetical protein